MLRILDRKLRSPLTAVSIIVMFVVFTAGMVFGLTNSSDEAVAQDRPSYPAPDLSTIVIPEDVTPIPVTVSREVTGGPAPTTKAYAEYKAAPPGRALYFRELDRVYHLPDDVHLRGMIVTGMCSTSDCPETPIYVLVKGESTISLDRYGNVIPGFYKDTYDPDAFPFLTEGE